MSEIDELFKSLNSTLRSIYKDIPDKELMRINDIFIPREIKKNELLVKAGDKTDLIAFNVSGLFRYYYINAEGVEYTKHFCSDNNFVSAYSSVLTGRESRFYIEAMEDSVLLFTDYDSWNKLLDGHSCWQIVARKVIENIFIIMEERENRLLLQDAKTRYSSFLKEFPELKGRLKQYHIASYLGITPITLSRIRSKMDLDQY